MILVHEHFIQNLLRTSSVLPVALHKSQTLDIYLFANLLKISMYFLKMKLFTFHLPAFTQDILTNLILFTCEWFAVTCFVSMILYKQDHP